MATIRTVEVSDWLKPDRTATEVNVFHGSTWHHDGPRRFTISLDTGPSGLTLRPTVAELRDLIAALEWALEPQEVEA